jgi:quercetin dioxygenase-like cupin family protein
VWRAEGLGGDVGDPHDAILGAANYLHASGAPSSSWQVSYAAGAAAAGGRRARARVAAMDARVVPEGGGERASEKARILSESEHAVVTDSLYRAGDEGPGPHIHRYHTDSFWVVDGTVVFEVGAERLEAPAGTWVSVPPGVVHTFRNEGPGYARFLNFHTPGARFGDHLRANAAGLPSPWFDSEDA